MGNNILILLVKHDLQVGIFIYGYIFCGIMSTKSVYLSARSWYFCTFFWWCFVKTFPSLSLKSGFTSRTILSSFRTSNQFLVCSRRWFCRVSSISFSLDVGIGRGILDFLIFFFYIISLWNSSSRVVSRPSWCRNGFLCRGWSWSLVF